LAVTADVARARLGAAFFAAAVRFGRVARPASTGARNWPV
jgi:hypothetical protein